MTANKPRDGGPAKIVARDEWQLEQLRSIRGEPARYKVDELPDAVVTNKWIERAKVTLGTCARPVEDA